jgi:hypothetical protein
MENVAGGSAPRKRILEADGDEIDRFVRALFRHASPRTYVSLRCFPQHDGGDGFRIRPFGLGDDNLDLLVEYATEQATWAAANDGVFCPPVCTFCGAERAGEAELADGLVLSVELDDGNTDSKVAALESVLGPATVIVISGGLWNDPDSQAQYWKMHGHWRLAEPARTSEALQQLKTCRKVAAAIIGGDPTSASAVHPLRWPGSWHLKAVPRLAQIIELTGHEIDLRTALFALDEVARKVGVADHIRLPPRPRAHRAKTYTGKAHPMLREYAIAAVYDAVDAIAATPAGSRNTTLNKQTYKLMCRYVVPGALDVQELIEALAAAALLCGLDERQIKRTLESAVAAALQHGGW